MAVGGSHITLLSKTQAPVVCGGPQRAGGARWCRRGTRLASPQVASGAGAARFAVPITSIQEGGSIPRRIRPFTAAREAGTAATCTPALLKLRRSVIFSEERLAQETVAPAQFPDARVSPTAPAGLAEGDSVKGRRLATGALIMLYFACAVLRAPLEVAMPGLVADAASTSFTTAGVGALMAMASATQGAGKIINSYIVDRSSPAVHMLVLTGMAAGATLLLPLLLHSSFALTAACYCTVRFCCGGAWLAATKLLRTWHGPATLGGAIGLVAMTSRGAAASAGVVFGHALGGLSPATYGRIFLGAGALGVSAFLLARGFLKEGPGYASVAAAPGTTGDIRIVGAGEASKKRRRTLLGLGEDDGADLSAFEVLQRVARTEALWWLLLARVCCTSMLELSCFLPMYVASLGYSAGVAGQIAACFTVGCALAVVAGGALYGRLAPRRRMALVVSCMGAFMAATAALIALPPALCTTAPLIFAMGAASGVPFYIPFTMFTNAHGARYSATVEGLTEFGAIVAMVGFDMLVGALASDSWTKVLLVVAGTVGVGAVAMTKFLGLEVADGDKRARRGQARRVVSPAGPRRWGRLGPQPIWEA